MFSGSWDISDEDSGETIARTRDGGNARLIEEAPKMHGLLNECLGLLKTAAIRAAMKDIGLCDKNGNFKLHRDIADILSRIDGE